MKSSRAKFPFNYLVGYGRQFEAYVAAFNVADDVWVWRVKLANGCNVGIELSDFYKLKKSMKFVLLLL